MSREETKDGMLTSERKKLRPREEMGKSEETHHDVGGWEESRLAERAEVGCKHVRVPPLQEIWNGSHSLARSTHGY